MCFCHLRVLWVVLNCILKNTIFVAKSLDPDQSKKEGKGQESIQSSTTPDPGYQWESDKVTIRHHEQEPSLFPAGDHKASTNRHA